MFESDMKSVIWDFNGTILDDVELATGSMNELLRRRNLPPIDKATHRRVFRFPVSDYYRSLGFDINIESPPRRGFRKISCVGVSVVY